MAAEIIFHHLNAIIPFLLPNPASPFSVALDEHILIFSSLFVVYFILPKISSQIFKYSSIQRINVVSQH